MRTNAWKLLAGAAFALALTALPGRLAAESLDEAATHVRVRAVLLEHFGTDALGIEIGVSGAEVSLSGTVEKANTQELAPQAAKSVKGVEKVDNRIQVGATSVSKAKVSADRTATKLKNSLLEAKVKARLFDQVGGNALKISVEASGGVVRLTGTVPTPEIRTTAVDTARKTGGVKRVHDALSVG